MAVKCDLSNPNASYPYCAKPAPAYFFTVLFGITTLTHIFQAFWYRKKFSWVIIMAGTWETVGFATRIVSTQNQLSLTYIYPSQILILLAPLWVNAYDYMLLGRIVQYWVPDRKLFGVQARRVALYYVLLDIVSFFIQVTGGLMLNSTDSKTVQLGLHVYMAGVGVQELFILIFCYCIFRFQRKERTTGLVQREINWRRTVYVMYGSLALITVRIIFRLIEFSRGLDSKIPKTEWFFYVFDATPMFIAITLFNIWHPGQVLIGPESEFPKKPKLTKQERKELKERKKAEKKAKQELKKQNRWWKKRGDEESSDSIAL